MYNITSAVTCRTLAIVRSLPLPGCDYALVRLALFGMYILAEAVQNFISAGATSTLKTHTVSILHATKKKTKHFSLENSTFYGTFWSYLTPICRRLPFYFPHFPSGKLRSPWVLHIITVSWFNDLKENVNKKVSAHDLEILKATRGIVRKSHRTFTVTSHPKNNKSKAISSLFLIKMIAKLERTQSNAYQNKDQHRNPSDNGRGINSNRTTALERTAA